MRMQTRRPPNRRKAIRHALARLGMQAKSHEVIAHLAGYDIAVSETLVQRVRLDMLRKIGDQRRQPLKSLGQRTHLRRPPKVPPRRGWRP
jgi:hypothetical protein